MANEKQIQLQVNVPREELIIMGNAAALQILIRNLVDNAIRYTPKSGLVQLTILHRNHSVDLMVADNGPGVPSEYRERIFERFFRILGNEAPGSGLGLSIVKQIVDLHQATLNLKATDPKTDKGLTVIVNFPFVSNGLN
jgi:two-component system sensor histidine kinase QseC